MAVAPTVPAAAATGADHMDERDEMMEVESDELLEQDVDLGGDDAGDEDLDR